TMAMMIHPLHTWTWSSRIASQIPKTSVPRPPARTTVVPTFVIGPIATVAPGVSTLRDATMRYQKRAIDPASAKALRRWSARSQLVKVTARVMERQPMDPAMPMQTRTDGSGDHQGQRQSPLVDTTARHLRLLTETIAAVNSSLDLQEVLDLV